MLRLLSSIASSSRRFVVVLEVLAGRVERPQQGRDHCNTEYTATRHEPCFRERLVPPFVALASALLPLVPFGLLAGVAGATSGSVPRVSFF